MACRVASIVVVAVFLLVQAVAEEPKPCCWISQMYGACMVQEDKELEDGTIVVEDTLAEFAYDKTFSAKAFIFTETFENGTQLIARIVELSDLGIAYFIQDNQGQTKCSKKRIPARFKPNCVPEAARFWSNATLGDHALNGNIWERNKFEDGLLTNTTYLMAADYCVPLSVNHVVYNLNPSPPEVDLVTYDYADVRLGICDRDKFFHIPEECSQSQDAMTPFMEKKLKQRQMMEMPFRLDTLM
ncbi:uncharacterized protein LOC119737743 isoform X1 [Patiria miniata]|uniref:Uncharacterized protein n=1 Tax=Patiria miniata TaxID=46514 RepID=A0A914AX08_PATMI|nr:uncharacterized protein LOC119737743 isoform X1 [Patiria miniata]